MNDHTRPDKTCPPPDDQCWLPDPPVQVPDFVVRSTIETLTWLDEFLRCHASQAVHAELDAFCQAQGGDYVHWSIALFTAIYTPEETTT